MPPSGQDPKWTGMPPSGQTPFKWTPYPYTKQDPKWTERKLKMEREEIINKLAEYFDIEPNENGEYDLSDYEWTAGCRMDGYTWLSLANVVEALTR